MEDVVVWSERRITHGADFIDFIEFGPRPIFSIDWAIPLSFERTI